MSDPTFGVKIWEQEVVIPTYPVGKPDQNPMFLEKRVYQGSSGKVYPFPVIDRIGDEKIDQTYRAVFLENEYLLIMILPELGGRVQRALDKTNRYDFVYYNRVIKPALVGLAGPWISGGIEFNWPQHHRPSTYSPVDYLLKENADGSKTVWLSEIDRMYGTKGMAGLTLYPGKAYLEIKAQLYNRTAVPQTFLWWANPAVAVNVHTQSVFPPDVHAVFDHGKRAVATFPIATGTYYKVDYSAGVDISRYKNIPVPTSYMAVHSDFDFVGGYDHGKQAGLLHVADHHVSPGKKQWTWGCGDFGQAWDRNLTDADGPYIELMTGVFTDNQPDFTWINPYEEKRFTQYFMPYKKVGMVKKATVDAAVNLEVTGGKIRALVYATAVFPKARIELKGKRNIYIQATRELSPEQVFTAEAELSPDDRETDLNLTVKDSSGRILIAYTPVTLGDEPIPQPAAAIPAPQEIATTEGLYLAGLHLEQYRHATYEPEAYYLEGLRRDPGDIRINNAYGALLFRRGQFQKSEPYFRRAIQTATRHNSNPYDGEAYYNLGLSLKMQEKTDEAYAAFYKACWNGAMQDCGYYHLAKIAASKGQYHLALEHIEKSLARNYHNYQARNLKTALYRKIEAFDQAKQFAWETVNLDILDLGARHELFLICRMTGKTAEAEQAFNELQQLMRDNVHNYLEVSIDYADAGMFTEAAAVLQMLIANGQVGPEPNPMVDYYLGWYLEKLGQPDRALEYYGRGAAAQPAYCFPNKLQDILVLTRVRQVNPGDAKALYYLGNLWYDRKQYPEAVACWERSKELDNSFPTVHRNLALAYYNKLHEPQKARAALERAFQLNKADARVFLELDQLYKKINIAPGERLRNFEKYFTLVAMRDDLYVEYITLLNLTGQYEKAKTLALQRQFHPWEGGEGKITAQYVLSNLEIGKQYLETKDYHAAIAAFKAAETYPLNLGEGKLFGAQENHLHYYLGCAYDGLGELEKAKEYFAKAAVGLEEPASAMFYNDQPPETIFYQGLALLKLGRSEQAGGKFTKLVDYGAKHLADHVTIDYFAVSLPDFLIFDEDLDRKNLVHCHYLMALGYLGLGEAGKAREEFQQVRQLDHNHLGAYIW
jgi:tetratricopeptide (TPR) repeat protein